MWSKQKRRRPDETSSAHIAAGGVGNGDPKPNDCAHEPVGSPPSFDLILQLFYKKVYNLAYRLLGNSDEAADLTQETFVKAYKAYSGFRGEQGAAYSWLCRIAINGCKNKFKEMSRRSRYEDASSDFDDGASDAFDAPEGILERQELTDRINDAVQSLPPELRLVVVLRDIQGLSYQEIADASGLPMALVKARLFRGRIIIRRRLGPYISE
jgi:RNA polymerase sigma-70 factor, ECF subfamily